MSIFKQIPEPAVSRRGLITGAGCFWILGGCILILRAFTLHNLSFSGHWWLVPPALMVGIAKAIYVFKRVVRRNITRIRNLSPDKTKICLFAFQSLESYLLVIGMIALGLLLRATPLPVIWIATIYIAIGAALITSSAFYFKAAAQS